ncbi:MAG: hypothetical protein IKV94_02910 [Clostridia bacterium]|nr:hypothetical protein [Clostridia bacterium]
MKKGNVGVIVLITLLFVTVIALAGALLYFNTEESPLNNDNQSNNNSELTGNNNEGTIDNSQQNKDDEDKVDDVQQNKDNEDKVDNSQSNTIQSLKIDNALVVKLYNYILKLNFNGEKLVYQSQKVTNRNLDNQIKLLTIFENLDKNEAKKVKTDEPAVRLDDDGNAYKYIYSKEIVMNKAKEIFGKDVVLVHENFFIGTSNKIVYSDGQYNSYMLSTGGGPAAWDNSYSELVKAEKDNNNIYIYDKYLHVVKEDLAVYGIYTASDRKVKIGTVQGFEGIEENKNKASEFKHTFTKNEDGNYYWVSTEIIKSSSANVNSNSAITPEVFTSEEKDYLRKATIKLLEEANITGGITSDNLEKLYTALMNSEDNDLLQVEAREFVEILKAVLISKDETTINKVWNSSRENSKKLVENLMLIIRAKDLASKADLANIKLAVSLAYAQGLANGQIANTEDDLAYTKAGEPMIADDYYEELVKSGEGTLSELKSKCKITVSVPGGAPQVEAK